MEENKYFLARDTTTRHSDICDIPRDSPLASSFFYISMVQCNTYNREKATIQLRERESGEELYTGGHERMYTHIHEGTKSMRGKAEGGRALTI